MSISNGDGIVRIWNSQADSLSSQMTSVFVQGKTKIMTVSIVFHLVIGMNSFNLFNPNHFFFSEI